MRDQNDKKERARTGRRPYSPPAIAREEVFERVSEGCTLLSLKGGCTGALNTRVS